MGRQGAVAGFGLIGLGLAWIVVSTLLIVVAVLTGRDRLSPVAFLLVGLIALPTGLWLNRRRSSG